MEVFKSKYLCYLIMYKFIDKDLLNFSMTNKYINKLSNNEIFWKNKSQEKHGKVEKLDDITWKNFYKKKLPYPTPKNSDFTGREINVSQYGYANFQMIETGYILFQNHAGDIFVLTNKTEEVLERKIGETDFELIKNMGILISKGVEKN
jgi:hypothetical protein